MATGFRARVLVAEDEEFTLNLLREVLEGANFQVEAVTSVAEAIALVASFDPHVVITDLNFGVGPSGADLLQFVEKDHPWVGKVVLTSHASPALAIPYGGGQTAARRMAEAGLLACGIGLPIAAVEGDLNGLRIGTPEIVRLGMKVEHMDQLADFIARSLDASVDSQSVKREVTQWRKQFSGVHYTVDLPN